MPGMEFALHGSSGNVQRRNGLKASKYSIGDDQVRCTGFVLSSACTLGSDALQDSLILLSLRITVFSTGSYLPVKMEVTAHTHLLEEKNYAWIASQNRIRLRNHVRTLQYLKLQNQRA